MLTMSLPAALQGDAFADELSAAGLPVEREDVSVVGDRVAVSSLDDSQRAEAQAVLDGHVPPPPPPDPDAELDAALAAVDTSTVADTATRDALNAVIAALRGQSGRKGAAAGRRPA